MKIAVIGTGGVGGYFGSRLAISGHEVTFVARGPHLEAILKNGLKVVSPLGQTLILPANATDRIESLSPVDLVLVCVKAWQVKEVAPSIGSLLHDKTVVLPLQNGVLATDELMSVLGCQPVLSGLCRIISLVESPGVIRHLGVEPALVFGEISNLKSERVMNLQKVMNESGIKARVPEDIHAEVWKKFISICVGGLMAITHSTYGQMLEDLKKRQWMKELIVEVFNLAIASGISIEPEFPEKTMTFMQSFPYNSTASLTRDIWERRPSEIDYQNGTVVKLGEKLGVKTPVNRFVYESVLKLY